MPVKAGSENRVGRERQKQEGTWYGESRERLFSKYWKWSRKESALRASMWEHVTPLTSCPALENKTRGWEKTGLGKAGKEKKEKAELM